MEAVVNCNEIYYLGQFADPVKLNQYADLDSYFDFDGSYLWVPHDHLNYRYEILGMLGEGSFGIILDAFDHKYRRNVAIKCMKSGALYDYDEKREIDILKHLNQVGNTKFIVQVFDDFIFRGCRFFVLEKLKETMSTIAYKFNRQGLGHELLRSIASTVFKSLAIIHASHVIHFDIKPDNLLLAESSIKVIDFSCSYQLHEIDANSDIGGSLIYKSPETLMSGPLTPAVDVWSAACTLVELYLAFPLFPAKNETELVCLITKLIGSPSETFLSKCNNRKKALFEPFYRTSEEEDLSQSFTEKMKLCLPSHVFNLLTLLCNCNHKKNLHVKDRIDNEFVDLISCCLRWDPRDRITAMDALKHPYIRQNGNRVSRSNDAAFPVYSLASRLISQDICYDLKRTTSSPF